MNKGVDHMRIHLSVLCLDPTEVQRKALLLQVVSPETDPGTRSGVHVVYLGGDPGKYSGGMGKEGREGEEALHSQLITLHLQSVVL